MLIRPFRQRTMRHALKSSMAEAVLVVCLIGIVALAANLGSDMVAPFQPPKVPIPEIQLDPVHLPYYLARSTFRMFIALGLSLVFTLVYAYVAANSRRAERVMIPLLDVLQSVPVLGFLSVTVTGFMALFPNSLLGLECASIFAIFTGQAWNMAFAFYQSLRVMPRELKEASRMYQLGRWSRFRRLDLPFGMTPLVWNAMMSFGGGWFFVAASESISVLNQRFSLPGIGSYVTKAIEVQDSRALIWAVVSMALLVITIDQLFWRPIVAWADKFKLDQSPGREEPTSWFLDLLRASKLQGWLTERVERAFHWRSRRTKEFVPLRGFEESRGRGSKLGELAFNTVLISAVTALAGIGLTFVLTEVPPDEIGRAALYGLFTLMRVMVLVVVSSLVWVPVGVAIGLQPGFAKFAQPVAQFLASFPANFLFPFITALLISRNISLDFGGIVLMALGAQWYVLFNVIAGAQGIPGEYRELARALGLKRKELWRNLILPGIFPSYISGAVTAAGGAWNASIVAETVQWVDKTLVAHGLGAYVSEATRTGDWPRIVLGVGMMSILVVGVNRLLWVRLYAYAEQRYSMS